MSDRWRLNDDGTATFVTDNNGEIIIDQDNFFDTAFDDIIDIQKGHEDYHEYSFLNDLGIPITDVDIGTLQAALASFAIAFGPKYLKFAGPGFVRHSSANPNVVTNYTTNLHFLDPGVVQRSIVMKEGKYHILTVGIGTGYFKEHNLKYVKDVWGYADRNLKDWVENHKDTDSFQLVPVHRKVIGDRQDTQALSDRLQNLPEAKIENLKASDESKNKSIGESYWGEPEEIVSSEVDIQKRISEDTQQKRQLLNSDDIDKKTYPPGFLNDYARNALLHPQVLR
ncbi:hypothetical protein [Kiloniella antarctica]|uniref:Uncharacterized protein n=1 Tax=Kiloniella antarctica TaxID=1550907 RepID=A0ABW5BL57_9PROT